MDKLVKYKQVTRQIIEGVLLKMAQVKDYEVLVSIDERRGQYLILTDGWNGIERSYGTLVHIEVKENAKVWLRYDGTDLEVGQDLLDRGIAASDLVLAFLSPAMRSYTAFATA
jgi:XisI protein